MSKPAEPAATWPTHEWGPTRVRVGPCAWSVAMLAGPHAAFAREHPSLVVVGPDDGDATLRAAAPSLGDLPLLLSVHEPAFARWLPDLVRGRLALLGRSRAEIVAVWPDEVTDLKGGGTVQALTRLRGEGVLDHIAAGHADVRHAEWLALHTPVRVLLLPYSLADQAARYRALDAAEEHGMACMATPPIATSESGHETTRFALAETGRALPVFSEPPPAGLAPMTAGEVETAWLRYREAHTEPEPLPRGKPPD